ncbi:hypothetical protein ZWY2020_024661 [Hordeum vulgare]|nr:hypothetical protein ZWY2020_024661 [Hordeum vulgare]
MAQGRSAGERKSRKPALAAWWRKAEAAVVEEGGFLSTMASKIGVAMSGTNRGSGAEDRSEGNGSSDGNALAVSDGDEEKAAGNGIFHKLLSSSSPYPPATEEERRGGKDEDEGGGGNGEQAGILSAMASKIGMAMSGHGTHSSNGSRKVLITVKVTARTRRRRRETPSRAPTAVGSLSRSCPTSLIQRLGAPMLRRHPFSSPSSTTRLALDILLGGTRYFWV